MSQFDGLLEEDLCADCVTCLQQDLAGQVMGLPVIRGESDQPPGGRQAGGCQLHAVAQAEGGQGTPDGRAVGASCAARFR